MAVWNYPEISLEDSLKAIKGFIDMLILASGYQSSGRLAHWDSGNIKRALQWALFIEDVGTLKLLLFFESLLCELLISLVLCKMIDCYCDTSIVYCLWSFFCRESNCKFASLVIGIIG